MILTGDIHGDPTHRLSTQSLKSQGLESESTVLILGDAGLIWNHSTAQKEEYFIKFLDNKPFTTYCVLGNHEGYHRIKQLPVVDHCGGPMYKVSDSVFYLQHGYIYTIEDRRVFVFGGALSIDKAYRKFGVSWWPDEIPSHEDYHRALHLLATHPDIDLVVSHTAPHHVISQIYEADDKFEDPTADMLDGIERYIPKKIPWYFGHFHIERSLYIDGRTYECIYENLKKI